VESIEKIRDIVVRMSKACEWQEPETVTEIDWNIWGTSCGNTHQFEDGGPEENKYRFCPYCGRRVVVIESETYGSSCEEDLYPGSWQAKAKHGTTTIRPEFPVHYNDL